MIGSEADRYAEIATNRGEPPQAFASVPSGSSTITKSAVSAFSTICTRTVAVSGTSVKVTCRSACQGASAIWSEDPPASMQGRGPGISSLCANRPARTSGTAEAKIPIRNMTHTRSTQARKRRAYGWQSVKKTSYRRVDGRSILRGRSPSSGGAPEIFGQRAVGQRLGQMQPADLVRAVEIG